MPERLPADRHFQHLAHLIQLEAEAEKQEDLRAMQHHLSAGAEATGNSLVNLVIRDEDAGLGGSILLTLAKRNQNLSLPWTRLGTGSPVIFSAEEQGGPPENTAGWRGVVSRISRRFHPGGFCGVARGWSPGRIWTAHLPPGPFQR